MIMACKRKKGFGEEDDELDNDIDDNQEQKCRFKRKGGVLCTK